MEHVLYEVERTETGSLRTEDGTAPGHTLAGEHAGVVFAGELLVHTVEEADFAAADAYVTCGNVGIYADVVPQLLHECLAETHDFSIGFANRVEVGTTLRTAHRERGEGVLESLLETEELQHGGVHGLVETQTALVRTDRAVELYAVAEVGLYFALVVNPGYTEGEDTVRLNDALNDLGLLEFGVLVVHLFDGFENLAYCLQIFAFARVAKLEICHQFLNIHDRKLLVCLKKMLI